MAYSYFKDLSRKTASDKVLRDKAFNIAKNPKYDGYRGGLPSKINKFLIKNCLVLILLLRTQINLRVVLKIM